MKKNLLFLFLMSFVLVGCQDYDEDLESQLEEDAEVSTELQELSITLGVPTNDDSSDTRVYIDRGNMGAEDDWSFSWEFNDSVNAVFYYDDDENKGYTAHKFTTYAVYDENGEPTEDKGPRATFTGTFTPGVEEGDVVRFIYPYNEGAISIEGGYTINIKDQTIYFDENDSDYLYQYYAEHNLYLISDSFAIDNENTTFSEGETTSDDSQNNYASLAVSHLMSGMELYIKPSGISEGDSYKLAKATIVGIGNEAIVNFAGAAMNASSGQDTGITLTVAGNAPDLADSKYGNTDANALRIPFSAFPTNGISNEVVITLEMEDGSKYVTTKSTMKGEKLLAGYHYILDVTFDPNDTGDYYLSTFDATTKLKEEAIYTILDVTATETDFYGLEAALAAEQNVGTEIELVFPNLTAVPGSALNGCTGFTSVELTAATSIGASAFFECVDLSTITVSDNLITIGSGAFKSTQITEINAENVKTIGANAFDNCDNLTSVSFPSVTSIGGSAFLDCLVLADVNLPVVKSIGTTAFSLCDALKSVNLGAGNTNDDDDDQTITSIGSKCFYGSKITDTELWIKDNGEENITDNSQYALENTTLSITSSGSTQVYVFGSINGQSKEWYLSDFSDTMMPSGTTWTILDATIADTDALSGLRSALLSLSESERKEITVVFENVTSIPSGAFNGWVCLYDARFPVVTKILSDAFNNCNNLEILSLGFNGTGVSSISAYDCFATGVKDDGDFVNEMLNLDLYINVDLDVETNNITVDTDSSRLTTGSTTYTFKSISISDVEE